jgi:hypothetical protein
MYSSLGGLVEGWSKNVATGALQTTAGWLLPLILPLSLVVGAFLWLLPPAVLGWAFFTGAGGLPLHFGGLITGFCVLFWGLAAGIMGGNPLYGVFYPLGSIVAAYIFLLSWVRGGRIRWRGRTYSMSRDARFGRAEENEARNEGPMAPFTGEEKGTGDPGRKEGGGP